MFDDHDGTYVPGGYVDAQGVFYGCAAAVLCVCVLCYKHISKDIFHMIVSDSTRMRTVLHM